MGLDLLYSDGADEYGVRFSDAEWKCLAKVGELAPEEVETLFEVPDFGEPVTVRTADAISSVKRVLVLLKERSDVLPATYQFRMENHMGTGLPGHWGGGMASGIRMPGDDEHFYSIDAMGDKCVWEKWRLNDGSLVTRHALTPDDRLVTQTCGRIDVRRRVSSTGFRKKLQGLHDFLSGLTTESVTKVLC